MITAETKKAINTLVPLTVAGIAGAVAWKSKARWQVLIVVILAAYILSLVLSKQALRLVSTITDKPPAVDVPVGVGGSVPIGFDAERWATLLRDDVYTIFKMRDNDLYRQLAGMNESQLAAIGNAFNRLYYAEHQESIVQAMKAENYGNDWFNDVAANAGNVIARLQAIGFN